MAMTCCADDTTFIGYICEFPKAKSLLMGQWVEVTAVVDWKYMEQYEGEGRCDRQGYQIRTASGG